MHQESSSYKFFELLFNQAENLALQGIHIINLSNFFFSKLIHINHSCCFKEDIVKQMFVSKTLQLIIESLTNKNINIY